MTDSAPIPDDFDPASARLYGIIARRARRAVIFRRGPTRSVRLISWNLESDSIESGQWFHGRIYERRCDLTPDGDFLVYFAAKFRKPLYSWTAISRPPYFTALALWPKGDCWGGGGLFEANGNLRLNHRRQEFKLADGFARPRIRVAALGEHSGDGEDDPIMSLHRTRDGWVQEVNKSQVREGKRSSRYSWTFDPPLTMYKLVPDALGTKLVLRTHAIHERMGRWYADTADLMDQDGKVVFPFGRIDWADVDHNGDLLYAKNGCLFRLSNPASPRKNKSPAPHLICDLNDMTFEAISSPDWAKTWD